VGIHCIPLSPVIYHLHSWALLSPQSVVALLLSWCLPHLPSAVSLPVLKRGILLFSETSRSSRRLAPVASSSCWRKFLCLSALRELDCKRAGFSDHCCSLAFGGKSKSPVHNQMFLHVCSTCSPGWKKSLRFCVDICKELLWLQLIKLNACQV